MKEWAALISAISWPAISLIAIALFWKDIKSLIDAVAGQIRKGASIRTPIGSLGPVPSDIKAPERNEPITENNMALIHSSWRYPKKDREFGRIMYCFHAIIQAPSEVLDRIEFVKYHLHPSYPNPVQQVTDRKSHFKLKELAYGESNLRAEVKVKEQNDLISLSRYINLTETGPKIP
jgi:hypothetical protein